MSWGLESVVKPEKHSPGFSPGRISRNCAVFPAPAEPCRGDVLGGPIQPMSKQMQSATAQPVLGLLTPLTSDFARGKV